MKKVLQVANINWSFVQRCVGGTERVIPALNFPCNWKACINSLNYSCSASVTVVVMYVIGVLINVFLYYSKIFYIFLCVVLIICYAPNCLSNCPEHSILIMCCPCVCFCMLLFTHCSIVS